MCFHHFRSISNFNSLNKVDCYIVFVVQYTLDRCKLIVFYYLFVMHTAYGISLRGLIFIAICFEIQSLINVRELRMTIQSDWQHRVHNAKTKQNHNTICVAHHYMQANTKVRHEPSYKRLEVKTNPMSFLC